MEKKVESVDEQLETRHYDIGVLTFLTNIYIFHQFYNETRKVSTEDYIASTIVLGIATILAVFYARTTFSGAFAIVFGIFSIFYLMVTMFL